MIPIFVLYLIMGLIDLWVTLLAFSIGVGEANPIFNYAFIVGFFIPEKIIITILVAAGLAFLYPKSPRWTWISLYIMLGFLIFHAWAFGQLAKYPPPLPTNSEPPIYSSPYHYNVLPIQS